MNADVIVTEVDPRRALEAHMEGYDVMPMHEAASEGDVFVTTTGNRDVITRADFERMEDGALLANAGHFDVEINLDELGEMAVSTREVRDGVEEYELPDGRRLNVLAEGRLVNLAELAAHPDAYDAGVHEVPDRLDREVAEVKLAAEGIAIDGLSDTQREYMDSWDHGT